MKKTGIMTDSHSGILQSEADELGIGVLPMPFYIDEKYEGTEFYYEVKGNKIYYTESTNGMGLPSSSDSLEIRFHNDTLMAVVWFNPSIKFNETFLLKRMMK